ncbi:MAG: lipopolysaccharide assembly protein LapA domain-containing protein [Ktedonobacterales bacterium]
MQRFSTTISSLVAVVILVILALFAFTNQLPLQVQFLRWTFDANLWWVVVGSVLLGALCALLLLAPGRLAAAWRNRSFRREQTHRELDSLRGEHATRASWDQERAALVAENQRLQAENQRLQAKRDGGANITAVNH